MRKIKFEDIITKVAPRMIPAQQWANTKWMSRSRPYPRDSIRERDRRRKQMGLL